MTKVVFLSNAPIGSAFRLGSHHLTRELARLGYETFHISTPVSTVERVLGKEVRSRRHPFAGPKLSPAHKNLTQGPWEDEEGVTHSFPRTLLPVRWVRHQPAVAKALRGLHLTASDFVVIDQLLLSPALRETPAHIIYRPADIQTSELGAKLERQVLARADALVACSSVVATELGPTMQGRPSMVLENGVDPAFFVPHLATREPSFVYVGALDNRFDWDFVIGLAESYPELAMRLAGPMNQVKRKLPENVQLLGTIDYEHVPALLRSSSVGLLPLSDDPMNAGRSPMKYYEYLASGLYVLARRTPELAARPEVAGVRLYASRAEGLAGARELLGATPPNVPGAEVARQFSWTLRAQRLQELLQIVGAGPGSV